MALQQENALSLVKGGEMGELTRRYDWATTPLGSIAQWPVSLRVQVQMMLSSKFPMLIFWGPQLITFYNDAFRPSLGDNGKHPSSLGQRGEESWAESWPTIGPMIYNIMAGGEAVWFEDQKLPLYRNGHLGYAYWTYSFSPISNDEGRVGGVLVTCSETTKAVESLQELKQTAARLDNIFKQVNAGIAQTDFSGQFTEVNDRFCQMVGYSREELLVKKITEITHPEDGPLYRQRLKKLIGNEEEFFISRRYLRKDGSTFWVNDNVTFVDDASGNKQITSVSIDVTLEKLHQLKIRESEARFQNLIRDVEVGMVVLMGEEMRVTIVNEAYCRLIGHSVAETINRPLFEVIPEAESPFLPVLLKVLHTGEPFSLEGTTYSVHGADGQPISGFINFIYQPYRESDGTITGVMAVVQDVTRQTIALKQAEESEARFRKLVAEAPVAIGLFRGRDLIIETPNDAFVDVIGRGPEIEGKALARVMPELESQPFIQLLQSVFDSGESFRMSEARVTIKKEKKSVEQYFNLTFSPIFENGVVTAVLDISVDVTEQVRARQKLEHNEATLKSAIELARLATWSIDLEKDLVTYSSRLQEWLGVAERRYLLEASPMVYEGDRIRITNALWAACAAGGSGSFDETYTIVHLKTGQKRIIHSLGKAVFNDEGKATSISGTSQDVTAQQELQMALGNKVQLRTEELAASAEELKSINEELVESNRLLSQSNDELAQYAYVASHDLQEPLRKIRVFTSILSETDGMSSHNSAIINKISGSANRMSQLIQDLLAFSRLLKSDTMMRPVMLNETVEAVWEDFELLVQEKGATIEVGNLPVIEGVNLQMNQLFHNLISNALKFTIAGRVPHIRITSQPVVVNEIKDLITRPFSFCNYHHIIVSDNGIGFEAQYNDQIFEVFKRLHTRDMYPGSGIGLSLCRRIMANHNGHLYAESQIGQGSTFHIIVPEKQSDAVSIFPDSPVIFPTTS